MILEKKTISVCVQDFIDQLTTSRSPNTAKTYRNGMLIFLETLGENGFNVEQDSISKLNEDSIIWFSNSLKYLAPTSERLYLTAVTQFFEYLAAEKLARVNLARLRLLIKQRARRPGQRLPQFPNDAIRKVIDYIDNLILTQDEDQHEKLRRLRDRAFLYSGRHGSTRPRSRNLRRGD